MLREGSSGSSDPEAALAADYKGGFGTTDDTSGLATQNQVYMGTLYNGAGGPEMGPHGGSGSVAPDKGNDKYLTKSQAYNFLGSMSVKQLSDLQYRMTLAGLIKDGDGLVEMQSKWKNLVDASLMFSKSGAKFTPMDILMSYLGQGPLGGKGGLGMGQGSPWQVQYRGGRKFLVNSQTGEVQYQGPRFETTYNKTIDLTDPTTAKAIATSVFQQLMHRDPGQGELAGYGDALRKAEQANPTVTQTTTEYDMNTGEPIGQTNNQTGGFGADAKAYLAQQRAKQSKEYASTQAATTYMGALEKAILNNPFGGG